MNVPIFQSETRWECPNCDFTDVTHNVGPHSRYHPCAGLKGLSAPMVPEGVKAKVEAVEREDYVDGDLPQYDGDGVPIMAIVTIRDEGEDCTVLAPTTQASFR